MNQKLLGAIAIVVAFCVFGILSFTGIGTSGDLTSVKIVGKKVIEHQNDTYSCYLEFSNGQKREVFCRDMDRFSKGDWAVTRN